MGILKTIGIGLIIAVILFAGFLLKAVSKMEEEIRAERAGREEE